MSSNNSKEKWTVSWRSWNINKNLYVKTIALSERDHNTLRPNCKLPSSLNRNPQFPKLPDPLLWNPAETATDRNQNLALQSLLLSVFITMQNVGSCARSWKYPKFSITSPWCKQEPHSDISIYKSLKLLTCLWEQIFFIYSAIAADWKKTSIPN